MSCPPILFVIFNRPDTTTQVFEAIRRAQPTRLYVAADGPRAGKEGEAARCDEVRLISTQVDWPCELKTLFRDQNCGCRRAVSGAITWFFENENEGIILEDDCLPHHSFFTYCADLLERYRDNPRVMVISGDNTLPIEFPANTSYVFSKYPLIWGWASWARAWKHYDYSRFATMDHGAVLARLTADRRAQDKWENTLREVAREKIDTWDYPWSYAIWESGGLATIPEVNLVSNIGFGPDATHTIGDGPHAAKATYELVTPLRHPQVVTNRIIDRAIERYYHGIVKPAPIYLRAAHRLLPILKSHIF